MCPVTHMRIRYILFYNFLFSICCIFCLCFFRQLHSDHHVLLHFQKRWSKFKRESDILICCPHFICCSIGIISFSNEQFNALFFLFHVFFRFSVCTIRINLLLYARPKLVAHTVQQLDFAHFCLSNSIIEPIACFKV